MKSGEQTLKLNFPDDYNEVHAEKVTGNKFSQKLSEFSVSFHLRIKRKKEKGAKNEPKVPEHLNSNYQNSMMQNFSILRKL